jgi:hypothetical protein
MTDVAEGTIVRVITRLDETCREVRDAARVIGDAVLMKKMEEAQSKIRRDSQYLGEPKLISTDQLQLSLLPACISKSPVQSQISNRDVVKRRRDCERGILSISQCGSVITFFRHRFL